MGKGRGCGEGAGETALTIITSVEGTQATCCWVPNYAQKQHACAGIKQSASMDLSGVKYSLAVVAAAMVHDQI